MKVNAAWAPGPLRIICPTTPLLQYSSSRQGQTKPATRKRDTRIPEALTPKPPNPEAKPVEGIRAISPYTVNPSLGFRVFRDEVHA